VSTLSFVSALGWTLADDRAALIQQVKAANDIVDVVGSYVTLRPAGATFKGLCPFHDDRRPSFDVDPRRQRYRCWACNKYGDVISFVQEQERLSFLEALELLARRAGISLEKKGNFQQNQGRALMLDVMRWASEQFQQCLLDLPLAEAARVYLGERRLTGETVRRWGLGYAPLSGDWLVQRGTEADISFELLEKVGLIAKRTPHPNPSPQGGEGNTAATRPPGERGWGEGYYDRFRDRVMFPIRDARGHTVAFGGRILPSSPYAERGPKYYNSSETPLFKKSEQIYGLDLARHAAQGAGCLAVVEGYTDVLMAHQMGVPQVVATMGTALNARHVQQLRRFTSRVVLVFDADAGGETGVDRALEVFVSQDVDLKIATLPEGLDPCDLLLAQGAEAFQAALTNAVDVLEFKLDRVWQVEANNGVEGRRRAIDAVLRIIALAPPLPGQAGAVKQDLMINRIAQRFALREETVRARLQELRNEREARVERDTRGALNPTTEPRVAPAPKLEIDLLTVLLAEPALVPKALAEVRPQEVEHPGLRLLLEGLYRLHAEGVLAELDRLRPRIDNPRLLEKALEMQDQGRAVADRAGWLENILKRYRERRAQPVKQELQSQLHAANDHAAAVELLRQLQSRTSG
jgi:DNA primase